MAGLCIAAVTALSCGGRQRPEDRGESAFEEAQELHRKAEADHRRTREALFDQARDKYQESCREGNQEACLVHDQLDAALRERRGECRNEDECSAQGQAWLPSSRGEQRLRELCQGERVQIAGRASLPKWKPYGPSCAALGEFYRDANRARYAAYFYRRACDELGFAPGCLGEAERVIGNTSVTEPDVHDPRLSDVIRLAEPYAKRGCDGGCGEACVLLAQLEIAHHRLRFPDVHSLRYSLEEAEPKELLLSAKVAAERGCKLGVKEACQLGEATAAELARTEKLLESGCVFLKNCESGQVCNAKTGRCEGRGKKGGFYAAYEKGVALFDARDYRGANKAFERARRMAPHLPGPWRWLGLIAARQGRYNDCVAATQEALRLNPESVHAHAMRTLVMHCRSVTGR